MRRRRKWIAAMIAALFLQSVLPIGWTETVSELQTNIVDDSSVEPTQTFENEISVALSEIIEPTATPEASEIPIETLSPEPSEVPEDMILSEPSEMPIETLSPEASEVPEDMLLPELSDVPETTDMPEATANPEAEDQQPEDLPEPTAPTLEIPKRDDSIGWKGVVQTNEKGMAIPMLFQSDYRAMVCYYNGKAKSVATSGCGAVSVSMIIAYLTGNTEQNPYSLFCEAVDEGRYHGNGLSHDTLSHFAKEYGVESKWISNDKAVILDALNAGKPIIAHMGEGIFTEKGHYIVLRGVTEDGLILLNDPNSRSNCSKAFPIETLLREARTSASFMVCWVEAEEEATIEPTVEPTVETEEVPTEPTAEATAEPEEASAEPTPEPTTETEEVPAEPTSESINEAEIALLSGSEGEILWGDINGSGKVDMNDVQFIYDVCNGKWTDDALIAQCDLNGDGHVDILDVQMLANYVRNGVNGDEL